jgi:hypothetical protein
MTIEALLRGNAPSTIFNQIGRLNAPGRPRREVDVELLRELRAKGYGYKRIAGEYTRVTGEYISHTTVRERLVDG